MNIDILNTFLSVLEFRNFNIAADHLGVTQSTVSTRIKSLENALGATLFMRGRIGAIPTAAGLRFESHARQLLSSWNNARRDTGSSQSHDRTLRLSGQLSLVRSVLVDWVLTLKQQAPRMAFDLQADYSAQIVNDLSIGLTDIGVLYAPQYLPELSIREEGFERFVMVSNQTDDLNKVEPESYIYTNYTPYFDRCHHELLPALASSSISISHEGLAHELLLNIEGTTYLPRKLALELVEEISNLCLVKDAPEITQPIFSAVPVRKQNSSEVNWALDILKTLI